MVKSLQARLRILFLSFAALMVVSVGLIYWELGRQRQDAVLINVAGRQRMLAQQMTLLAVGSVEFNDPAAPVALEHSNRLFEESLKALRNGGAAPEMPGTASILPPTTDPEALSQIESISQSWAAYRDAQASLLSLPPGSPGLEPARLDLETRSADLLAKSNALVLLYQAESVSRVTRLRVIEIGVFICALLILAAGAWVTQRSILGPLRSLREAAQRIGENDLDTPIRLPAPQELGDLAQSLDDMRGHLRSSRSELVELAGTLEQRVAQRTRELEALNEVSREISAQLNVQQVLDSVTGKARSLLGAEVASLCLLDGTGDWLNLRALSGPQAAILAGTAPSKDQFANSVLTGHGAMAGVNCMGGCQMLAAEYRGSHLAAPLRIGHQVIGALCVGSSQAGSFSGDATGILSKLANTAAIALENARLYAQAERVATLEERNRIAAEMHDGLGQTLSYLGLMTDREIEFLAEGRDQAALDQLHHTRETIEKAVNETRRAINSLVSASPLDLDIKEALDAALADFAVGHDIAVAWEPEIQGKVPCPPAVAEQVLNITREAMHNAARHSHASRILVRMGERDSYRFVSVEDDGQGFDPTIPTPAGHFGLQIMHARAAQIGAHVEIVSKPGQGTSVKLAWPKGNG